MLRIVVPGNELYDEELEEFINSDGFVLELEHSLHSISKWESIFCKPFLTRDSKSIEEVITYIECMIVSSEVPKDAVKKLSKDNLEDINSYIESKQSATWFSDLQKGSRSKEVITSELIYYWMISCNIPIECQYWHVNRLFNLIRIFSIKNANPKKMSRNEVLAKNRELNAQRKAQLGTRG